MKPLRRAPRAEAPASRVGRVIASSVLASSAGGVCAWLYASHALPPELLAAGHGNLYACLGAVSAVLTLRLGSVLRSVIRDFLRSRPR